MPRNIEIKARISSVETVLPRALALAAGDAVTIVQDDCFYRVAQGRLKLRRFADGSSGATWLFLVRTAKEPGR